IDELLHIIDAAGDGDDRIMLGHNEAILAKRAIAAIGAVAAAPELIAVALIPIAFRVAAVGSLSRCGRLNPRLRHELLALPLSFLQIKLAELRDVFGANAEAKSAG